MGDKSNSSIICQFYVVIAAPSDLEADRKAATKAIQKVNRILEAMGKRYRLVLRDQFKVRPEAGIAQAIVDDNLQIRNSHIFIGIFGQRFGSPPGLERPSDGKPYLSGTEKEVDDAFTARRLNNNLRPSIMLYRKADPTPSGMTDEQIRQYAKVVDFFKECEPNGAHPAFFWSYNSGELEEYLEQHLMQVCAEHEKVWLEQAEGIIA